MRNDKIVCAGRNTLTVIETEWIYYIESGDHGVLIHCLGEIFTVRKSLKEIENKLAGRGFIRIHRSYIIALDHIRSIEDNSVTLDDFIKTEIPLGIKYERRLFETMRKNYLFL